MVHFSDSGFRERLEDIAWSKYFFTFTLEQTDDSFTLTQDHMPSQAYPYTASLLTLMHETNFPTVLTAQEIESKDGGQDNCESGVDQYFRYDIISYLGWNVTPSGAVTLTL